MIFRICCASEHERLDFVKKYSEKLKPFNPKECPENKYAWNPWTLWSEDKDGDDLHSYFEIEVKDLKSLMELEAATGHGLIIGKEDGIDYIKIYDGYIG